MNIVARFGPRVLLRPLCCFHFVSRAFCDYSPGSDSDESSSSSCDDGFGHIERLIRESWKLSDFDRTMEVDDDNENGNNQDFSSKTFFETTRSDADRLFDTLRQDGPGFHLKSALDELNVRISDCVVRQVLLKILKIIDNDNRAVFARLAYKFFVWSSNHDCYRHTVNMYHLLMKIFVVAEEFKALWRLVDEMTEKGYPMTARTFNILICCCRDVGLQRTMVEKFIRQKTFNYRPFKHSYNAILYCLLDVNQHRLVEWVYNLMLSDGHSPDVLTFNIIIVAQYRLGKLDNVYRLLDEMSKAGFSPDLHTYNILLHILGKGNRPLAAVHLLNHMREEGVHPSSLHFATLIDGLSRYGDMDACKYFFDEMSKNDVKPDVVCYTVLINGYIAAGQLEKAQQLFDEMIVEGHLPNVFTYNTMIRGLCMAEKFDEACSMLKDMESKGCPPNFLVYRNLISNLRRAGKHKRAHRIMKDMIEKGLFVGHISRTKTYRK